MLKLENIQINKAQLGIKEVVKAYLGTTLVYENTKPFTFEIDTTKVSTGSSASNQFTIPTTGSGYLYNISTSDGYTANGVTGSHTITFPSGSGTHTVEITGRFPQLYFNNGGDKLKMLDIQNFGIYGLGSTSQSNAFYGCSNMTISTSDVGNFGGVTNFFQTWRECSSLTSFPLIDTSSGTNFRLAWFNCSSLTSFPLIDTSSGTNFSYTWLRCSSLTSFPLIDTSSGTDFSLAWYDCSSLTSFPLIDTSSGTNFYQAWYQCLSLTSFPLIDTSNGTSFNDAWYNCPSLTSFPLIDTSSGTNFDRTWLNCSSLTSFPLIDTSSGTNFDRTWYNCSSLTSFPLIDTSNVTRFDRAWERCSSLTSFPSEAFDNCPATNFDRAFDITNLNTQSIDDILVSIAFAGESNGTFLQSGGSAPSATGQDAIVNLVNNGWTIITTS